MAKTPKRAHTSSATIHDVGKVLGNVVAGTALVAALARAQVTAGAPDTHARHLGRNR
jgi:hypothetical protein